MMTCNQNSYTCVTRQLLRPITPSNAKSINGRMRARIGRSCATKRTRMRQQVMMLHGRLLASSSSFDSHDQRPATSPNYNTVSVRTTACSLQRPRTSPLGSLTCRHQCSLTHTHPHTPTPPHTPTANN